MRDLATDKARVDLLKEEYFQLQKIIEDFDGKSLTIKAWSVTLSAAALVAAYVEAKPFALLVASGSAIAFWIVEAFWKAMQQAFYVRLRQIELWMRGDPQPIDPLQITTAWGTAWEAEGRILKTLHTVIWPHVFMPHLAIAIAGIVLHRWWPPILPPAG